MKNKKKICHCGHCLHEPDCADNEWSLYVEYDPCCPNMKEGRRQHKEFLKEYIENRDFIDHHYYE